MKIDCLLVDSANHPSVRAIYASYESYFPRDERRSETQFLELFENPHVQIFSLQTNSTPIGYLILWPLSCSLFVEHFEIFETLRGQSFGSKVLTELIKKNVNVVLEAEPQDLSPDAWRRIKFYQNLGFSAIDTAYQQPPYEPDKNALDLWLLSTEKPRDLRALKEEIYKTVYTQ